MKTRSILSILLVMVITMTACVAKPNAQPATSEPVIITTVAPSVETTNSIEEKSELKVICLNEKIIEEMTSEEISELFENMVHISSTEILSADDMYQMGLNFRNIYWYSSCNYEQEEFEAQSYAAFCNIYNQAIEQNIFLEELYSWTFIPVSNVLYKYFSSTNFNSTIRISCPTFNKLEYDDAIRLAETFFESPLFASNCNLAHDVIRHSSTTIQDMGLAHLIALSKSSDTELLSEYSTYGACMKFFSSEAMYKHTEEFSEIAQNIMKNSEYDFVEKYTFFCNDDLIEKSISNMAFDTLLGLAKTANKKTREQIEEVANHMYDIDAANKLLNELKSNY